MTSHNSASEPFVLFELAGTTYAIASPLVQQMDMVEKITPVPNAPEFVEGVVFSRGQVIPAVNLRKRFGLDRIEHTLKSRLIIVSHEERQVGLLVDSAREFVLVPTDLIKPPPESLAGMGARFLQSIVTLQDRLVLILNIPEVLASTQLTSAA